MYPFTCQPCTIVKVVYNIYLYVLHNSSLGQLGLGADCDQHSPRKVQVPVESPPARACCGVDCSLVITESGQLLAAGNNRWGLFNITWRFCNVSLCKQQVSSYSVYVCIAAVTDTNYIDATSVYLSAFVYNSFKI